MERGFLQALFLDIVGSQELVSGNCVAQKACASIKEFFYFQGVNSLLTSCAKARRSLCTAYFLFPQMNVSQLDK